MRRWLNIWKEWIGILERIKGNRDYTRYNELMKRDPCSHPVIWILNEEYLNERVTL
jgi:hypothetical protein